MPPKNKKQAEEEAKRQEEEQRKRQEEEARLEVERLKYAGQTLTTGLYLPVTSQLLLDFPSVPLQFVTEKLKAAIKTVDEEFETTQSHQTILKELHYYVKEARNLFDLQKCKEIENNESSFLKARVFIGIVFGVLSKAKPFGNHNSNISDQIAELKRLFSCHSIDQKPQKMAVFQQADVMACFTTMKNQYFGHFELLSKFNKFKKRTDQLQSNIYISCPSYFQNTKETPFTDLSEAALKQKEGENDKGDAKEGQQKKEEANPSQEAVLK